MLRLVISGAQLVINRQSQYWAELSGIIISRFFPVPICVQWLDEEEDAPLLQNEGLITKFDLKM
jgi:hypothetical protein